MNRCRACLFAGLLAGTVVARPELPSGELTLSAGDWIGEIRLRDGSQFVHIRFGGDTSGARAVADLPTSNAFGLRVALQRYADARLVFTLPLGRDTATFTGLVTADSIDGTLVAGTRHGTLHLIHRIAYDSALVRPLAGNYAIASDRVISMGPMDEANGWLSFFDSKTRRGGILYALNDSMFFTGPTFSVDYPIAIRAIVRRDAGGGILGLRWEERGRASLIAMRLRDYRQENVSFNNGNVRLVGHVTVPNSPGRHRAVILIHGCCGTIPTRDFGYWSVYLAHHGIAVLAFDKRGGGASGGNANTASYEDLADDVIAGLGMLEKRNDIDPRAIGLFGMSNGGYIAPLAATRSNGRVAFVAVRAGSARPVGGNIDYEVGNDLRSEGFEEADVQQGVAIRRRVTDFVINRPSISAVAWDSLRAEVAPVQQSRWFPWSRTAWVPLISPSDTAAAAFLNALRTAWQYDPMPYWKHVRVPVYIMLGKLDRSVPSEETAAALRHAFRESGNANALVRLFPNGNHGLLIARTGYEREVSSLGYYVPGFQSSLVAWIHAKVARRH